MNDLERYFQQNQGNLINKWHHYFKVYDRHFSRFRGQELHLLEIGVRHGGSLQMWKEYFGPQVKIYGVDIHPETGKLAEDQIEIIIGDQEDRGFLAELAARLPRIDIAIDDGGHTMVGQIATFEELFPHVAENGVYVCEDTHTSYWTQFGGGFREPDSFIEHMKGLVDDLHAWHNREKHEGLQVTEITRTLESISFYDSMVVLEKGHHPKPTLSHTGKKRIHTRARATALPVDN